MMTKPTFIPVSVGEDGRERDADGHTKRFLVYQHSIEFGNRVRDLIHELFLGAGGPECRETVEKFCEDVLDCVLCGGMAYVEEHLLSPTERLAMFEYANKIAHIPSAVLANPSEPDNIPEFSLELVDICDAVLD